MTKQIQILFFDDKKFLLKGLQRQFNKFYTCHIATTKEEVDEIMKDNKIDILVSDHQTPNDCGIKLLERNKSNSDMRRILTTSDRHSDLVLTMLGEGLVHAIVYTPLSRSILAEEIEAQVLKLKELRSE